MKKNGQQMIDNLTFDDGRTGWKSVTRVAELNRHLQKWRSNSFICFMLTSPTLPSSMLITFS